MDSARLLEITIFASAWAFSLMLLASAKKTMPLILMLTASALMRAACDWAFALASVIISAILTSILALSSSTSALQIAISSDASALEIAISSAASALETAISSAASALEIAISSAASALEIAISALASSLILAASVKAASRRP
eukprot:scaffold45954_cov62-Phaeocystis_antarctica.AAC.6